MSSDPFKAQGTIFANSKGFGIRFVFTRALSSVKVLVGYQSHQVTRGHIGDPYGSAVPTVTVVVGKDESQFAHILGHTEIGGEADSICPVRNRVAAHRLNLDRISSAEIKVGQRVGIGDTCYLRTIHSQVPGCCIRRPADLGRGAAVIVDSKSERFGAGRSLTGSVIQSSLGKEVLQAD